MKNLENLTKKQLRTILKERRYDEKFIQWLCSKKTAKGLKTFIENDDTIDAIIKVAKEE